MTALTALTTTPEGWAATVRTVRWPVLAVGPVASVAALLGFQALDAPAPALLVAGQTGLALIAATAAFVVDDPSRHAAPATPTEAPARLGARMVVAVPVLAAGWLLAYATLRACAGAAAPRLGDELLAALAVAAAAGGMGAVAGRAWGVASPGAAGLAGMAVLTVARQVIPASWLATAPPAGLTAGVVVVMGAVAVVVATREPAG